MPYKLTILGTSSATPTVTRHPSAQYLFFGSQAILLDCGEGTQIQIMRFGLKSFKINTILISHLHPDHYLGLIGLLSTFSLKGRKSALTLYGPAGLKEIMEVQFRNAEIHLTYPLEIRELPDAPELTLLKEEGDHRISCFSLQHRLPCWGFLIEEKKAPFKIRKSALDDKNMPVEAYAYLKKGKDYTAADGKVYEVKKYTIRNTPPISYAYITDTLYLPQLAEQLKDRNVQVLYHEATFLDELADRAAETCHSTARQAAEFALLCETKKLLIGHFSSRYSQLKPLEEEARSVFLNTDLAEEGKTFDLSS